jgi:hypothetical protein
MTKIIIIGYPKSGNTWLSRLTAELVGCPVSGFLYSNHEEIAMEGLNRESEFEVYKSHHQFHELAKEDLKSAKLLYVLRDPRDVLISGISHFSVSLFPKNDESSNSLDSKFIHFFKRNIDRVYWRFIGKGLSKKRMNKAVLYGNEEVHPWLRVSWKAHITPYMENPEVLKVKYGALLRDPLVESKRILDFLGIEKDENEIQEAIDKQSFEKVKEKFKEQKQTDKAQFLRKGKSKQWKKVFSKKEKQVFIDTLSKELIELGYDLE